MKFVDYARIRVKGGRGGDGAATFRREKFVPRGGPDGGDGGKGGSVYLETDPSLLTLLDFHYENEFVAEDGQHGRNKKLHGKKGKDLIIKVPVGTVVRDPETGQVLVDMNRPDLRVLVARGGRGGRGNVHFTTPTRRAPRFAERGYPGEERELILELKLIADVGLVGLPNAGKSTLISRLTDAHPKIASYPFTTLSPVIGIMRLDNGKSVVIADMPGIIENAHKGKGLGLEFLKHIDRTRLLAYVIDASGYEVDPNVAIETVRRELEHYNPELLNKDSILVFNKMDVVGYSPDVKERLLKLATQNGFSYDDVVFVSAVTGYGLDDLRRLIGKKVEGYVLKHYGKKRGEKEYTLIELPPVPFYTYDIKKIGENEWSVTGPIIKYLMSYDLNNTASFNYVMHWLKKLRLESELRKKGAKEGDTIYLEGKPFELF